MTYILYTVLLFNLLIIIFKLFERYKVDNLQALIINYFTAAFCGYIFLKKSISISNILDSPWIYHALILGSLFIVVFNFYAYGTQKIGVSITTIANRMSLVIPVSAALLFDPNDNITFLKIIGFILALIGIYLTSTNKGKLSFNKKYIWLILFVFVGQGILDTVFNDSKDLLSQGDDMQFFISLFLIAGMCGLLILITRSISTPSKFQMKNIFWGILFGVPNFFSLFFFLKALNSPDLNSSVVFPLVSMGVVVFSALIGILLFKEKLSLNNWIGILFAAASIAVFSI